MHYFIKLALHLQLAEQHASWSPQAEDLNYRDFSSEVSPG